MSVRNLFNPGYTSLIYNELYYLILSRMTHNYPDKFTHDIFLNFNNYSSLE